ncbi:hypothetical protein GQ54DRAFT_30454 [Martensiomyces pterosporus]|nr:hypothetical protein GQ54DRAFT_30454 [Martensiomyces pterosporus]
MSGNSFGPPYPNEKRAHLEPSDSRGRQTGAAAVPEQQLIEDTPPSYTDSHESYYSASRSTGSPSQPPYMTTAANPYPPAPPAFQGGSNSRYNPSPSAPAPQYPPPAGPPPAAAFQAQPQQPGYALGGSQQAEPVYIGLLNSQQISSGFSLAIPDSLRTLPTRQPFSGEQWTRFIRELNETLHRAPGTMTKGLTDFWLVRTATLGMATRATSMYQSHVENRATAVVESWNRMVFAPWGIHVTLEAIPMAESTVVHGPMSRGRRRRRDRRVAKGKTVAGVDYESSLELVVEQL